MRILDENMSNLQTPVNTGAGIQLLRETSWIPAFAGMTPVRLRQLEDSSEIVGCHIRFNLIADR